VIYSTKSLLGETEGLGLADPNVVPWITLLVIGSYLILLLWAFPVLVKVKVKQVSFSRHDLGNFVGTLILIIQLGYLLFCVKTGTGVAGSTNHSDSLMSPFWVLISADYLLFIYYGFYRSSHLFIPNLLVGIISNVLRGWNGIFILIVMMESSRLIRTGKLKPRHLLIAATLILLGYPVVWSFKWQVRELFSSGIGGGNLTRLLGGAAASLGLSGFFELAKMTFLGLFARLHLVSNVIAVFQNSHRLAQDVDAGLVNPFWREGVLGSVLDRLSGIRTPDLGVVLAQTISPWQETNWNSNPGYVGWFFVLPWVISLYFLYTAALGWISVYLVKKIKSDAMVLDMLWFAWCLYLVPGWIAAFTLFVVSLVVFHLLHIIAALLLGWISLLSIGSLEKVIPHNGLSNP
jgi:hypothetical protein